ncbi:MAG: hypothetical protein LBT16_07335 [Treponema sp.]|jgi:hypothetical protein|nr:hypothetical protein [Treponema sp.]
MDKFYRLRGGLLSCLFILVLAGRLLAAEDGGAEKPAPVPHSGSAWFKNLPFNASLLWTGAWENEGNLTDRGDLRLGAFGFSGRAQVIDKRPGFFWQDWEAGNTAYSGGLYHGLTGSRLLYGILEEQGLPARLRNPWGKSVPLADTRKPLTADLRTEPSSTREPETYLYLGSPRLGLPSGETFFRPYAAVQLDNNLAPSLGTGLDTQFAKKTSLRLEGFFTGNHLPPRGASTWFSNSPPLPERDFRLYGLGTFFTMPFFSLAGDGAYSEGFAWGQGWYGNLALRLGSSPWKLNLGATGADSRFIDRDGAITGAAFRLRSQFEWKWKRASLFRTGANIRAPRFGGDFDRGDISFYYRFPSNLKTGGPVPFKPVKISTEISRNAQDWENILDTATAALGFSLGPVGIGFSGTVIGSSVAPGNSSGTEAGASMSGQQPFPLPIPSAWEYNSAKVSGNISYSRRIAAFIAAFNGKAGYTTSKKKDPVWDGYISASIRGKPGRFTVKVSSPDFPEKWDYTLSWRLQLAVKGK